MGTCERMFENLTNKMTSIFDRLRGRGVLSETDVLDAMREIRIALLEADVALPVVKDFINKVKERAVGSEVLKSISPGQMVVKIVNDALRDMLGGEAEELKLGSAPSAILMVGLQGSGKTTTTAKLARRLKTKLNKKVLLVSLDVYRPAAQEQLAFLGTQIDVESLPIVEGQMPLDICDRALEFARRGGFDVVFFDTAGRLHIDDELMDELIAVKKKVAPSEILFVADAMTGQDAVTIADTFHKQVGITGVALTRLDGDARGGAALSIRAITQCPIKFVGVGEKVDALEPFHPERIATRILGMGDVVTLVEKAAEVIDKEEAEKMAEKMAKGSFDLNDFASQLKQLSKMGGISSFLNFLPGLGGMQDKLAQSGVNDKMVARQVAIIGSMTKRERRDPKILNASRKRRIASGSGVEVQDVNRLLKQFQDISQMMKQVTKMGKKGLMRQGLKSLLSRR